MVTIIKKQLHQERLHSIGLSIESSLWGQSSNAISVNDVNVDMFLSFSAPGFRSLRWV